MAESFGTGVNRCRSCDAPLSGRREQKYCSERCQHDGRRSESEKKYNLRAFESWTPDMAYALGLFFADGCLSRGPVGSWQVTFTNTDLPTVEWWHSFLDNPTKLYGHKPGPKRILQDYNSTATSDTLGDRLYALGAVPRKSTEPIRVPPVPDAVLAHFLRGFCDGDGSVGIRRRRTTMGNRLLVRTLACNSGLFREDLRALLLTRGITTSEYGIHLTMSGSDAERFCEFIYGEGGQAMTRKKTTWDEWVAFRNTSCGGLMHSADPKRLRGRAWHALVGTMPDVDVARLVGITEAGVRRARKKLGISPCNKGVPAWHSLAGTKPDEVIARLGHTHKSCVCLYRQKNGIPSYRSQLKKVA